MKPSVLPDEPTILNKEQMGQRSKVSKGAGYKV